MWFPAGLGWPADGAIAPSTATRIGVPAMSFLHRALARPAQGVGALRRRAASRPVVAVVAATALAGSGIAAAFAATPPPAHVNNTVGLAEVGPIDEANGFPLWYKDTNGVRLELCTDPNDQYCIMGDLPQPQSPVAFPTNFPDEAFWAVAESSIDAGGGESGILVTAVEAAFANEVPEDKAQVSFGRVRIRVAGVVDGAEYKVTHPFGTDTIVAEAGAVKGLNTTEDIGSLTWDGVFDQTLGARTGPFLRQTVGAPAGYLGDPTTANPVTGSPYNTNFFRVEGPAGSFTGSTDLCANPALGDDPQATDDCIQQNNFVVQGKLATRAGVQVTTATYRETGSGADKYIDLFAKSEPGQTLVVSGTGVSQTIMRSTGGKYFARIKVSGPPPSDLAVTNTTDAPRTVDHVDSDLFGDKVHIQSAIYDIDNKRFTVVADSGDSTAVLKLSGYPNVVPTVSGMNTVRTWTVNNVEVPPADAVVTSDKGGVDSDDVVVDGADLPSAQVVADLTASTTEAAIGTPINIDATATQGTVSSAVFSVTRNGTPVTSGVLSGTNLLSRTFTPNADGVWEVTISVTGPGNNNTDTETVAIHVASAQTLPVADAGADMLGIVPTSVVTLNGSASAFATSYLWQQMSGPAVTLSSTTTANATFTVPPSTTVSTIVMRLTVTNASGSHFDEVTITSNPDDLTVDAASYKAGGQEWRVRGGAEHCSANNTVTVKWNKPGSAAVTLGTATPALDLGVCSWDFRLKNAPSTMRPTAQTLGTITVTSVLGGSVVNRTYQLL